MNKLKTVIEDARKHVIIWPKDPVFTVNIPDTTEETSTEETPTEEHKHTDVPEVAEENEPVSE